MSTITAPRPDSHSPAHAWFDQRGPELRSRARVFVRRFQVGQRDDAVAEILAQIWNYTLSASRRGKLRFLTPFTLVSFFGRAYASGRQLVGTNTRDPLSPVSQKRHRLRVLSLDQPRRMQTQDGVTMMPLHEVLADHRINNPAEECRCDVDYPGILNRQHASRKARRIFAALAQTHATVRGIDLARQLRVSPPRIVQIKHELAQCLAAEDYLPPATRRVESRGKKRHRRQYSPPLNAGSSPPSTSRQRLRVRHDDNVRARRHISREVLVHA